MLFAGIRSTLLVISINFLFISIYTKNAFTQKALSNPPSASHSSRLNRKLGKDQELLIPFWTLEPGWVHNWKCGTTWPKAVSKSLPSADLGGCRAQAVLSCTFFRSDKEDRPYNSGERVGGTCRLVRIPPAAI